MSSVRAWSDALGWALLASLPDAGLAGQWGSLPAGPGGRPGGSGDRLRQDLPGFRSTVRQSLASRPTFINYMESH